MKILVTGGHLTPALSYIDWLQENKPSVKLCFLGRKFSQDFLQQESVEQYELEKRKVKFIPFLATRLGPHFLTNFFQEFPKFFKSIIQAKKILQAEKISIVVSFGGYLAVPVAIAAFLSRIPIITHEQTLTVGLANKIIGYLATKVAVSFSATSQYFSAKKVVITGNLLRKGVFSKQQTKPSWLKETKQPILLVMGGNQGSEALNELILACLPELVRDWMIVLQCGKPTNKRNYRQVFATAQSQLAEEFKNKLYVQEWLDEADLFWLYRHTKVALSRSGANATHELIVARVPSIFVPLPSSHQDEQYKNAKWLVDLGAAVLIDQQALNQTTLISALEKVVSLEEEIKNNLAQIKFSPIAPSKLHLLVEEVIKNCEN
ncbi:MAG: UDP-N-acetylglucosamine--N-acetylmuramyl-(pentapeptide) pyrophosphoryl-undecaprenol N-acetylglucosamine transferase [Patescibacteria group bacterium]